MIPTEDDFKHMRAERKWFKNVLLFPSKYPSLPSVADESGCVTKAIGSSSESTRNYQVNNGQVSAPDGDSLCLSKVDISEEAATQAIISIADVFAVSVTELREICTSSSGIESLGLDSLICLIIIYELINLGVIMPSSVSGSFFEQEILKCFLESFIMEYGDLVGPE